MSGISGSTHGVWVERLVKRAWIQPKTIQHLLYWTYGEARSGTQIGEDQGRGHAHKA